MQLAFDNAAVIADEFCYQCKSQTRALSLRRYERIEQVRGDFRGDARTVIPHADFKRQRNRLDVLARAQTNPRPIGGRQGDLSVNAIFANGFGSVFDQIQEYLDELVA